MNKVIAIVGMCGSGKSVATSYIAEKLGYKQVYFGGVTTKKLKELGLEINPQNEKMMREKIRSSLGMDAYAKILLPEILELSKDNNVVLDGLYSWSEYEYLIEKIPNLKLIAVVCDKNIRYNRLNERSVRPLSFDDAKNRDLAEINNIEKAPPIAFADYYVLNMGSVEDYTNRLRMIIEEME